MDSPTELGTVHENKIFSRGEKDFVNRNIVLEQYLKATVHPETSRKALVAGLSSVWID